MIRIKNIIFLLSKITISLMILCFSSSTLQANDKQQQVVLEVYPQWYSDQDYSVQGNLGIEKGFDSGESVKYYGKPSFSYALDNNWALHAGLGLYYTDNENRSSDFEIRPFQGISHFYPLTEKWRISSYLRVEERFQYDTDTWDKENTVRLRLRLRTAYTLNPLSLANSWHKLMFSVEGFKTYNQDESSIDIEDRYDRESIVKFGVERNLRDQQKVRFELAWKYKAKPGDIEDSSASTAYLKVQYYTTWGKSWTNKLNDKEIDQ